MAALARLASMEIKLFFREKQAVFWTFLFPVLMIWLFGVMFGKEKIAGMSYSDAYVPSWIAVNLLTTSLFTIGTTLSSYRQTGILRRFQATPLRSWVILASHMAYGLLVFCVSALVIVVFGAAAFQLDMPKYLGSTVIAAVLSVLALFPFGLFIASLAKNVRAAAAISSLLLNLMLFLSGATFPLEMMPSFLQYVAKGLPLYYVIDLLRHTWNFSSIWDNGLDVAVLVGMFVVFTVLAARFFRWSAD
ncbi:ABC transporter permease [Alicyclobacillus macrosporangiidus]|uniref:ABC transporter permease n=1 Tax=Alicyclobacillus macrosporangiidus TaxID=392015 RepID=UPI0004980179|nr:ABC transporter permease [Alicyclobacillus macrosporangiidus]